MKRLAIVGVYAIININKERTKTMTQITREQFLTASTVDLLKVGDIKEEKGGYIVTFLIDGDEIKTFIKLSNEMIKRHADIFGFDMNNFDVADYYQKEKNALHSYFFAQKFCSPLARFDVLDKNDTSKKEKLKDFDGFSLLSFKAFLDDELTLTYKYMDNSFTAVRHADKKDILSFILSDEEIFNKFAIFVLESNAENLSYHIEAYKERKAFVKSLAEANRPN